MLAAIDRAVSVLDAEAEAGSGSLGAV